MADTPINFEFAQGEHVEIIFTVSPVIDISSWDLAFTMRDMNDVLIANLTLSNGGIILHDPTNGKAKIIIQSEVTRLIPIGEYEYNIWRLNANSEDRQAFGIVSVDTQTQFR